MEFLDHFPTVTQKQAVSALELTKEMLVTHAGYAWRVCAERRADSYSLIQKEPLKAKSGSTEALCQWAVIERLTPPSTPPGPAGR